MEDSLYLPKATIFSKIQADKISSGRTSDESNDHSHANTLELFICGKFNEHSTDAKYSFSLMESFLLDPVKKSLYFTESNSFECIRTEANWDKPLFVKIRQSFQNQQAEKTTFKFLEKHANETDIESTDELTLQLDSHGELLFETRLSRLEVQNPEGEFFSKLQSYKKEDSSELLDLKTQLYVHQKERDQLVEDYKRKKIEDTRRREDKIFKFMLIYEEKEKKIDQSD